LNLSVIYDEINEYKHSRSQRHLLYKSAYTFWFPQMPGGSFTASLHQLLQLSSAAASSQMNIPGRPPNAAPVVPPVEALSDAATAALVAGLPGAFQPKVSNEL
jgi:hypothetical protein